MKMFKQFLESTSTAGNYVSIKASDPGDVWKEMGIQPPKSGETPPNGDYHVTLIYSEKSNENIDRITSVLDQSGFNYPYIYKVESAECFDADDASKSCIVLKLDAPAFHKVHDLLKSFGLTHSYPTFEPHLTLRYNMDIEEAHKYKDLINTSLETGNWKKLIKLNGMKSETLNKNYV